MNAAEYININAEKTFTLWCAIAWRLALGLTIWGYITYFAYQSSYYGSIQGMILYPGGLEKAISGSLKVGSAIILYFALKSALPQNHKGYVVRLVMLDSDGVECPDDVREFSTDIFISIWWSIIWRFWLFVLIVNWLYQFVADSPVFGIIRLILEVIISMWALYDSLVDSKHSGYSCRVVKATAVKRDGL